MLLRQAELLQATDKHLLLCRSSHLELPAALNTAKAPSANLDLALEAAEDLLLAGGAGESSAALAHPSPRPPSNLGPPGLLAPLRADLREAITDRLELHHYAACTVVMARQQESDGMFLVASGRFSIFLPIQRLQAPARLARMAHVVADTNGSCWVLKRSGLEQLQADNPAAAIALLTQLAVDLGRKLALCGQQLTLVEDL